MKLEANSDLNSILGSITYLHDLFDQVWHSAVRKNLTLGSLMVKQDVKGGIFVLVCPLVECTEQ